MKQGLKYFLTYAVAFAIPILLYAYKHINETNAFLTFAIPAVTFAIAGWFTANIGDESGKPSLKWIGWSTFVGLILGAIAYWS